MILSIIVPCYNSENYIERCLMSIKNQILSDFECIVVDDGSNDSTLEKIKNFSDGDRRFRVFVCEHKGVAAARNIGLDNALGDFVGFVDSDDWVDSDMFSVLLDDMCEYNVNMIKQGYQEKFVLNSCEFYKYVDLGYIWSILFRRDCALFLRFNENLRICEDLDFSIRLFDMIGRCLVTDKMLYHYENNPDSLTHIGLNVDYRFLRNTIEHCDNINVSFKNKFIEHIKRISQII